MWHHLLLAPVSISFFDYPWHIPLLLYESSFFDPDGGMMWKELDSMVGWGGDRMWLWWSRTLDYQMWRLQGCDSRHLSLSEYWVPLWWLLIWHSVLEQDADVILVEYYNARFRAILKSWSSKAFALLSTRFNYQMNFFWVEVFLRSYGSCESCFHESGCRNHHRRVSFRLVIESSHRDSNAILVVTFLVNTTLVLSWQ